LISTIHALRSASALRFPFPLTDDTWPPGAVDPEEPDAGECWHRSRCPDSHTNSQLAGQKSKKFNNMNTERIRLAFPPAFFRKVVTDGSGRNASIRSPSGAFRDRVKARMRRTHHDYDRAYPMD
jgi:hypothetical protein